MFTPDQIRNCKASVRREEGSDLGRQLLYEKKRAKQVEEERKTMTVKLEEDLEAKKKAEQEEEAVRLPKMSEILIEENVPLPVATYKRPLNAQGSKALKTQQSKTANKIVTRLFKAKTPAVATTSGATTEATKRRF